MKSEQFSVENVKCGGCVKAIVDGLDTIPGVTEVTVTVEGGQVTVLGEGITRETLAAKLAELGYPEAESG
ncbi:MAG TPA: copper chaperone [Gammaproteobacteria bacterium]|nr:copper chaperone [Gammaproteobacteria bacterium]